MFNKFQNFFYPLLITISIVIIFSALYIEYVLLVPACKLCLYQRIPYVICIIVCFFGLFFPNKIIWIYLLLVIFMTSIVISGYHLGIENNIFTEFSGCKNENLNTTDKAKLLESLNNYLPNCKSVSFRIFGLSLATFNFIISIALTVITIKYLLNEKNA